MDLKNVWRELHPSQIHFSCVLTKVEGLLAPKSSNHLHNPFHAHSTREGCQYNLSPEESLTISAITGNSYTLSMAQLISTILLILFPFLPVKLSSEDLFSSLWCQLMKSPTYLHPRPQCGQASKIPVSRKELQMMAFLPRSWRGRGATLYPKNTSKNQM